MRRLKKKDSSETYLRTISFIFRATRRYAATKTVGEPLARFIPLLRAAMREVSDALLEQTEATADAQLADFEGDDVTRQLHAELELLDRKDPTLAVVKKVFPDGLQAVIARTGDYQATQLDELVRRLAVAGQPALLEQYGPRLSASATAIRDAEVVQAKAFARVGAAHAAIRLEKARIREEIEAVYGALRMVFKASPKHAERFFPTAAARKRVDDAAEDPDDELDAAA